jgi:hypothetical protein
MLNNRNLVENVDCVRAIVSLNPNHDANAVFSK